jgi:sugar O-acyltransferase (sialic acid O-acetyltransferase NeuD family)
MKKLVLFGAGEIAELATYYFSEHTPYQIAAFCVDDAYVKQGIFNGKPVVAFSEIVKRFPPGSHDAFVAVSYSQMNKLRAEKYLALKKQGYAIATYVSPKATNFAKEIGENCFILEDNTLQPFVKIGNNVTMWSGNHIGHHSIIHDNVFITSHVVVSGGVTVKENAFLGVNATLRDHVTIGREALIAAGALIVDDVPDRAVMVGSKAKAAAKTSDQIDKI